MVAEQLPARAVVDSGVLIAFLNREAGRYERSKELLDDAEDGRIELWGPMVIQVEVVRWTKDADPADPEARAKLDDFLDSEWLQVVEVDRRMARIARDVVATTTVKTGVDALYVATAVIIGATAVYAWNDRIVGINYEGVEGLEPPGSLEPRLDLGG